MVGFLPNHSLYQIPLFFSIDRLHKVRNRILCNLSIDTSLAMCFRLLYNLHKKYFENLCILPIDIGSAGRWRLWRPVFIIPHPITFVNKQFAQKFNFPRSQNLCTLHKKFLLTRQHQFVIIEVPRVKENKQ